MPGAKKTKKPSGSDTSPPSEPQAPAAKKPRAKRTAKAALAPAPPAEPVTQAAESSEPEVLEPEVVEPAPDELEEVDAPAEVGAPHAALAPAEDRGIVRRDPLQAYMAEVNRHSLLTREQEHELAV